MSITTLERDITAKASVIAGKELKIKDLMEWQCGKGIAPRDDEVIYFIPELNIEASFKKKE